MAMEEDSGAGDRVPTTAPQTSAAAPAQGPPGARPCLLGRLLLALAAEERDATVRARLRRTLLDRLRRWAG